MAKTVIMPALGMAQETGKLIRWLKAEGSQVIKGEPLIEIETDKATVEVESPASGILTEISAGEGDEVPVGQAIAVIREPGEAPTPSAPPVPSTATPSASDAASAPVVSAASAVPSTATPSASDVASAPGASAASAVSSTPGGVRRITVQRPPASPKARRMARELGVDIAALSGTGLGGAVVATDVLAARAAEPAAQEATSPAPSPDVMTPSATWRLMAERTTRSWTTAPHFFLLREVNAGRLVAWREAWQRRFKANVTYTDLLVTLLAASLRQHPRLNATWDNGTIRVHPEINIGVAVATPDALVVPVVHKADALTLTEISSRLRDLVERAQAGKLHPEDVRGGTFTISNLGMYGVDGFAAVINPPQAAILAVGRIAQRVVAIEGEPRVQPMMMLSLSCDHRTVDGARGAQFLQTLAELIEEPLTILGGR